MIKLPEKSCLCFVLSSTRYGEDSAIISLAGEEGIFSVLARGVYKANSILKPLLITGNLLKLSYREGRHDFGIAVSLQVIEDNSALSSDYVRSCFLLFLQEVTFRLFQYGDSFPSHDIYLILYHLSHGSDVLSSALLALGCYARTLGVDSKTNGCVLCGRSDKLTSYSLELGGFICEECRKIKNIPPVETMQLYVFKYAFSPLKEETFLRKVPEKEGKIVLDDLLRHFCTCFDLHPWKTLSLFLDALEESK